MNIVKENNSDLTAVLKVNITKEDYSEKVDNVIKDYRKKAKIDGFRPGKVPMGLVQKMYGKGILVEEVNKLISESLTNYIRDEKLNLYFSQASNTSSEFLIKSALVVPSGINQTL